MKGGYKRLLILLICMICVILLDTIFFKLLTGYKMIAFLLFIMLIFYKFYIFENGNKRYFKETLFEIIFYTVLYFVLFYLLGLFVGLHRVPNYFTFKALKNIIVPIILICVFREILRYNMLRKADGNKILIVLVVLTIILIDICDETAIADFSSRYGILKYIALVLFPSLGRNISYSYLTRKVGYKPIIIFDLIFSLYPYFIPLLPNPSEYIMAIIYLMVPILFAFRMYNFFEKKKDDLIPSDYNKRNLKGMILPIIIVSTLVYFYSGYFRYYAVAIASGSMTPNILKGDIVILDQKKPHNIKEGDVIGYRHDSIIVVHRVVKKKDFKNESIYYTQGDANSHIDNLVIEEEMIIGKVKFKLPYIGYPTVWFNKE